MNIGTIFRGVLCPFDSGSRFLLYPDTFPLRSAEYRGMLLIISIGNKEYYSAWLYPHITEGDRRRFYGSKEKLQK